MNTLEKKLAAVMRLAVAEDDAEREKARAEIRVLMDETPAPKKLDAETLVREILLELGTPDHLIGQPYLVRAILMAIKDWRTLESITHGLYPKLASEFDTTASRVERTIRHVIEVTFDRADLDVMGKYFGNTISAMKGKPTNSEFIARIANVVKMRMKNAA